MIPPLCRCLLTLAGGMVFWAPPFLHATAPPLISLPVPGQARVFWDAHPGFNGWVYAARNALCGPDGIIWTPPSELIVAEPLPTGEIVLAGNGFCSILADGKESRLVSGTAGIFSSAAVQGGTVLVACPEGVWAIDRTGVVASLPMRGSSVRVFVFEWRGQLWVSSLERGNFAYRNGLFIPSRLPWGDGLWAQVDETPAGFLAALRDRLVFGRSAETARPVEMPPSVQAILKRELLEQWVVGNNELIFATFEGGLYGYHFENGKLGAQDFHFTATQLGGAPYFLRRAGAYLLLGTTTGIYQVGDPLNYSAAKLEVGVDLNSVIPTPSGYRILSQQGGIYTLEGTRLPGGGHLSEALLPEGKVTAQFPDITLPSGKHVDVGLREAPLMVPFEGKIAIVNGPHFLLLGSDGARTDLPLPPPNSEAILGGSLAIGTADGAFRFEKGQLRRWLGQGPTAIAEDRYRFVAALDSTGTLFDETGQVFGHVPPKAQLVGAALWRGQAVFLIRLPDGRYGLGSISGGEWTPFDFPFPVAPVGVYAENDRFYLVGEESIVSAARLYPEAAPDVRPHEPGASRYEPDPWRLPTNAHSASFRLPPQYSPWSQVAYSVRVAGGDWDLVKPGSQYFLPDLRWGATDVVIRADLAGRVYESSFTIDNPSPLWARWPVLLADSLAAVVLAWAVLLWRTRHLRRRAVVLEGMVNERTAELRKAQAAREEFFSSVSHEIRNPLNGVIGLCDMLNETGPTLGGRERSLVNTMKGCADQLRTILDDVLDFSKIDRGQIHIHEEVFELTAAIEGAARGIDPRLERCRLELGEPIWLRGDSGKIRQVVTNLVSNALKYGSPPLAGVKLQITPQVAGQLGVEIIISNTGATIAAADFERMFEGFARGGDVERRKIPGMGLGLAVSRRLMQAMKGALTGRSQEGLTEFVMQISLPRAEPPAEMQTPSEGPVEKVARALAIEDEAYNRLILGHLLGQLGYEVDWAVDGASALELAKANAYDLILTDFVLPDTDGATLARTILAMLPDPKPPVVAVTAYSTREKVAEARAAGITGFVAKPISRRKLEAAILGVGEADRSSRPIDLAPAGGEWDFSPLLRLPDGRQALAEFAEGLGSAWDHVAAQIAALEAGAPRAGAAKAVHAFRGRILTVQAQALAEQLSTLEQALRGEKASAAEVARMAALIKGLVQQLASAASDHALATNRSG